jgi:hypothetical protein
MKTIVLIIIICVTLFAGVFDTITPGAWIPTEQDNVSGAQILGWEKVNYATAIQSAVFAGAYFSRSSESQNALWAYHPGKNRWDLLDVAAGNSGPVKSDFLSVSGHDFGTSCYDESRHCLFIVNTWAMANIFQGLCHYDVRGNIGRLYYPIPGFPVSNAGSGSCYDPDSQCIYYMGGTQAGLRNRLVKYQVSTHHYTELANIPEEVQQAVPVYHRQLKKVIMLGDSTNGHVWLYDPALDTWEMASATHPINSKFKHFTYNCLTGQCLAHDRSSGKSWEYDGATDTWTDANVTTGANIGYAPLWSLVHDPYENLYVNLYKKYPGYGAGGFVMCSSDSVITLEPDSIIRRTHGTDTRWKLLGDTLAFHSNGWARAPRIANLNEALYLAWGELEPPASSLRNSTLCLARWNGSGWDSLARYIHDDHTDYPSLTVGDSAVYMGASDWKLWRGDRVHVYRRSTANETTDLIPDTASVAEGAILPVTLEFQGDWHCLYLNGNKADPIGGMGHGKWGTETGLWQIVDDSIEVKPGASANYSDVGVLRSPYSAVVTGDSLVCAYTSTPFTTTGYVAFQQIYASTGKAYRIKLKTFNGTIWSEMPAVTYANDSIVSTHPSLAYDSLNQILYIAYLKRPFIGKGNNELVVERFTGSGWIPMGNPLNVYDSHDDAWAFRPSLAVNSTGALYVAWTEHVWGSCPQVYAAHWNGADWERDVTEGNSLNMDGEGGSAQSVSLTFQDDYPTVAWCEHTFGDGRMRKVYVKQLEEKVSAVQGGGQVIREEESMVTVAPNPFNPVAVIQLNRGPQTRLQVSGQTKDRRQKIVLSIYTTAGHKVFSLDSDLWSLSSGISWNAAQLPSGLYIAKVMIERQIYTQRLLLQK